MWCLYLAVVLLVVGWTACKQSAEKQQEKAIENILEQGGAKNAKADVESGKIEMEMDGAKATINTEQREWPAAAPTVVPKFTYGQIQAVMYHEADGKKTWSVHFVEIQDGALEGYAAALKAAGFKTMKIAAGGGGSVTAEKGDMIVSMMMGDSKGVVGIQIPMEGQ